MAFVIAVDFQQHMAAIYWQVHLKLNAQYGGIIHDLDNLLSCNNERIDIPAIVTYKVIALMDLPTKTDVARLNQMCNSSAMTLRWLTYYRLETYCRLNKLAYVINDTTAANERVLHIRININRLHFKDDFKDNNFEEVSTDPLPNIPWKLQPQRHKIRTWIHLLPSMILLV